MRREREKSIDKRQRRARETTKLTVNCCVKMTATLPQKPNIFWPVPGYDDSQLGSSSAECGRER